MLYIAVLYGERYRGTCYILLTIKVSKMKKSPRRHFKKTNIENKVKKKKINKFSDDLKRLKWKETR